ncbi:MAG TPA: nuclear transport factor 2 family protein [Jatrophihabitantaceae bacterium]|nr:nuclear transport factor 2 family protein [Jatrophihabitantaceae bacterium]
MIDYAEVGTSYIAMWNATDEQDRAKLVAGLCTDDARYVDPTVVAEGSEAIAATIAGAQQQFPGWTFRLAGPVDGHHNQARFTWEFGPEGVDAPVVGFDVAVLSDEGKVVAVYGFLDKVPAAA